MIDYYLHSPSYSRCLLDMEDAETLRIEGMTVCITTLCSNPDTIQDPSEPWDSFKE